MASYDVSPLTYSVLANSFGSVRENDDELVRFQMSESIFKLINRINPGQLSGYFDHKVLEYIQLEF